MDNKQKIATMDRILEMVKESSPEQEYLTPIGTLNQKQGIKGFKTVEVGDIVFNKGERYYLVMETLDGKNSALIPYNKELLAPVITFNQ